MHQDKGKHDAVLFLVLETSNGNHDKHTTATKIRQADLAWPSG